MIFYLLRLFSYDFNSIWMVWKIEHLDPKILPLFRGLPLGVKRKRTGSSCLGMKCVTEVPVQGYKSFQ